METILRADKCTNSSNGGYIVTYSSSKEVKSPLGIIIRPFGKKYLAKLKEPVEVGETFRIDLTDFAVREDSFTGDDGNEVTVSWLDPK